MSVRQTPEHINPLDLLGLGSTHVPQSEYDIHSMMTDRHNTAMFKNIVKEAANKSAKPIEDEFGSCEIIFGA